MNQSTSLSIEIRDCELIIHRLIKNTVPVCSCLGSLPQAGDWHKAHRIGVFQLACAEPCQRLMVILFPLYHTLSLLRRPTRMVGGVRCAGPDTPHGVQDRKSTRLNSSHGYI